MDIVSVFEQFPTQDDCLDHIEAVRWPDGPVCPYCGSDRNTRMPKERRHHCNACNTSFSVTVGTIFHHTHLDLQKWFLALTLTLNAKKGISARQLARDIHVSKDTAWRIAMKIREAMVEREQRDLLTGIVEADEAYLGNSRSRRRHGPRKPPGRDPNKTMLVGMVERGPGGRAKIEVGDGLKKNDLSKIIRRNVDIANAILHTDEFPGYIGVKEFMPHSAVNHKAAYVDFSTFPSTHTNSIESFWANLKRGLVGQYHKVSLRYLPSYIDEFTYRFNHRGEGDMFERTLARGLGVAP